MRLAIDLLHLVENTFARNVFPLTPALTLLKHNIRTDEMNSFFEKVGRHL